MSKIALKLTGETGITTTHHFHPDYTRWIKPGPDDKGSLIFRLSTDSDDGDMPYSYFFLESPSEIAHRLNERGVETIEVKGAHFTYSGANLAINAPYTLRGNVGALNKKQQNRLSQFLDDCAAAAQKIIQESVTLSLGGNPEMVKQFFDAVQEVAARYGKIVSNHTYYPKSPMATTTVTVHCPSGETRQGFVEAVRQKLPVQGAMMAIGYGSSQ